MLFVSVITNNELYVVAICADIEINSVLFNKSLIS